MTPNQSCKKQSTHQPINNMESAEKQPTPQNSNDPSCCDCAPNCDCKPCDCGPSNCCPKK